MRTIETALSTLTEEIQEFCATTNAKKTDEDRLKENLQILKVSTLEEAINKYKPLLWATATKYAIYGCEKEDMFSEATIGLLYALHKTDKTKIPKNTAGAMTNFIAKCVNWHTLRAYLKQVSGSRALVYKSTFINEACDAPTTNEQNVNSEFIDEHNIMDETIVDPEELIMRKERLTVIEQIVGKDTTNMLIKKRLGYNLAEIARDYNISRERTRQILNKATKKLIMQIEDNE